MQIARRFVPVAAVDEVVPVRDLVVDGTARRHASDAAGAVAVGYAAIHAARCLVPDFLFRQRQHEFVPMLHALRDRLIVAIFTLNFEKPGDLPIPIPRPASWRPSPLPSRRARGGIRPASLCGTAVGNYPSWRESRRRA